MKPQTFEYWFNESDVPSHQLLALVLAMRRLPWSRPEWSACRWRLEIPQGVFESIDAEAFKRIFSDLVTEFFPKSETQLSIRISRADRFLLSPEPGEGLESMTRSEAVTRHESLARAPIPSESE